MVSSRGERLDGVMLVVNIELLGTLILNEKSALISDVSLQVGDRYFSSRHGLRKAHVPQGTVIYRQRLYGVSVYCQY